MVLLLLAPRLPPRLEDRGFISYVAIVIKKKAKLDVEFRAC